MQRPRGAKELGEMWIKCENEPIGSQAEELGMTHMIKNLKAWLWLSGFIGNRAIEGFLIGDGHT